MLQRELLAILSTFIKLSVVIKTLVSSIFEWPFYTGFTVIASSPKLLHVATGAYVTHLIQKVLGNLWCDPKVKKSEM